MRDIMCDLPNCSLDDQMPEDWKTESEGIEQVTTLAPNYRSFIRLTKGSSENGAAQVYVFFPYFLILFPFSSFSFCPAFFYFIVLFFLFSLILFYFSYSFCQSFFYFLFLFPFLSFFALPPIVLAVHLAHFQKRKMTT